MAITQVSSQSPSNEVIFTDSAMSNAVDAVKSSSATVYLVQVNNSGNATAVYVKLYNVASGSVTAGTTAPDQVLYVPGLATVTFQLLTGAAAGLVFGTALSAICVTTGGTAGITPPSSNVSVAIVYT